MTKMHKNKWSIRAHAFSNVTNDPYRTQWEQKPGSLGKTPIILTTKPQFTPSAENK